jgi:predicted SAM-dependent methyltransferase
MQTLKQTLKRSQFALGLVRTSRGLISDARVLTWLFGRQARIRKYVERRNIRKLQLGTSNNVLEGWLNTDIVPNSSAVVYMDATRRFPFADATFDYILSEHMIEHIDYDSAQDMLRECFRVLKPGGKIRFATPDLSVLLSLHAENKTADQDNYVQWSSARFFPGLEACKDVFVINNCFRAWGHCFLYDRKTLSSALQMVGFNSVKFWEPGSSDDPQLANLESHGKEIGNEQINKFETMVAEASKVE